MIEKILTCSDKMSKEYCCTVVQLGEIQEIPGANTVAKTLVNGRTIVIGKEHKEGEIMLYCSNESQLNFDFLSVNNLFSKVELNCNADEVNAWLNEKVDRSEDEVKEYLRTHRGYFNEKGRVRMTKLAGEISMGFLYDFELLAKWCPKLAEIKNELPSMVGKDFDTVNGELLVKPYVPELKVQDGAKKSRDYQRNKKLRKFNQMIPGQFSFHYDTQQFERMINTFKPEDVVTISNKLHGTSYIIGNVLTNKPKYGGLYSKLFLYLPKCLQFTVPKYDVIYSSRSVIKNEFINNGKTGFSAGLDKCFHKYYELLKDFIPEGVTLYGEIIGYVEESNSFIQTVGKGYDYKCKPGENQFMIYRVSSYNEETGYRKELNVQEVYVFTLELISLLTETGHEDIAKRIHPIDIYYHGALKDLYPDIEINDKWHDNFLERIKNDKENFGMELNEPMCRNAVPREGIVIRKQDDPINEAFKLKCLKFLGKEAAEMDKGVTTDMEMAERY